jgi:hypothetical protein
VRIRTLLSCVYRMRYRRWQRPARPAVPSGTDAGLRFLGRCRPKALAMTPISPPRLRQSERSDSTPRRAHGAAPTTARKVVQMESSTNLEYAAVRHVLTAPQIAPRTAEYVKAEDFDFTGLGREAETMSGGEKLLVAIAHELWHAEKKTGLWELVRRLDASNFERVLEALRIARGVDARGSVAGFLATHGRLAA